MYLAKIKSTKRRKQATNTHLSLPVKKVPQTNHKPTNQNNIMEKLITSVLYSVEYMVVGFWLVLGGDSEGYQLISIFDNIGFLSHEI